MSIAITGSGLEVTPNDHQNVLNWAIREAPGVPPSLITTLVAVAAYADVDGRGACVPASVVAKHVRKSERQTRRGLSELRRLGLLTPGDPNVVSHIPEQLRPEVYDLAMHLVRKPGDPEPPAPARPNALYRFFGVDDELLYVGITADVGARWKAHSKDKPWWREVIRTTIEHYDSREAVEAAEIAAIRAECPKYNIKHSAGRVTYSESAERVREFRERVDRVFAQNISGNEDEAIAALAGYAAALYDDIGEAAREELVADLSERDHAALTKATASALFVVADGYSAYLATGRPAPCYQGRTH